MTIIEIYGAEWDFATERLKALLTRNGIRYQYYDLELQPWTRADFLRRAKGRTAPLAFQGDTILGTDIEIAPMIAAGLLQSSFGEKA
jgi:glutaredoxin